MAVSNIQRTNHVAQISAPSKGQGKFKTRAAIQKAVRHNERLGDKPNKNEDFDPERKHLNKNLLTDAPFDIYTDLMNRLTGQKYTKENVPEYGKEEIHYEDGKKIYSSRSPELAEKKNSVLAFELEANYPGDLVWCMLDENKNPVPVPDGTYIGQVEITAKGKECTDEDGNRAIGKGYFRMPLNQQEFDEWCKSTVEFAQDRFGRENVVSAQLHMDENKPHIHLICTPVTMNEQGNYRLNYGKVLGGLDSYEHLQTEYANAVAHLNYKRGEINSTRINHFSTKDYKIRLSKEMTKEMPNTLEKAHETIKDLRVRNFTLEEDMREIRVSANKFQNLRNKNDKLREENQKLKEELAQKEQVLQQQKERIMIEENRKRCIDAGKKIAKEGPQLVEAYETMEQRFLKNGFLHMRSLGYTNEELRYWEDTNRDGVNDRTQNIDLDGDGIRDGFAPQD